MKPGKISIRGAILAVILAIAATILSLSLEKSLRASASKKQEKAEQRQERMPTALFNAPEPEDIKALSLRRARNSRYDNSSSISFDKLRPDTTEKFVYSHWWINLPGLPTFESDAVILGEVKDAKGYLSNDKTGAYTELGVNVIKIYKDDKRISAGSLVAERRGASVQLPDGRIIRYIVEGQGIPEAGKHYVLFLKYNYQGESYSILTGYTMNQGKVEPLDHAPVERFSAFKGMDEDLFIKALREAIEFPPRLPKDERMQNQ